MVNTEHLEISKQRVETCNAGGQQHREILPYLTDAALRGVDLRGAFLRYVHLGASSAWPPRGSSLHSLPCFKSIFATQHDGQASCR